MLGFLVVVVDIAFSVGEEILQFFFVSDWVFIIFMGFSVALPAFCMMEFKILELFSEGCKVDVQDLILILLQAHLLYYLVNCQTQIALVCNLIHLQYTYSIKFPLFILQFIICSGFFTFRKILIAVTQKIQWLCQELSMLLIEFKKNIATGAEQKTLHPHGRLKYEGEVKGDKAEGEGKLFLDDKLMGWGTFRENQLRKGQVILLNDMRYKGELQGWKLSGSGELTDGEGNFLQEKPQKYCFEVKESTEIKDSLNGAVYLENKVEKESIEGSFQKGMIEGTGKYTFSNGDVYEGQFRRGMIYGIGQYRQKGSFVAKGGFSGGTLNGECKIQFGGGAIYEGEMKDGLMHGKGIYTYEDGTKYDGQFYWHSMTGQCQINYPPHRDLLTYHGEAKDGLYNGLGVMEYRNGLIFKGYFYEGRKNGHGLFIYGTQKYKCLYIMDNLVGELTALP